LARASNASWGFEPLDGPAMPYDVPRKVLFSQLTIIEMICTVLALAPAQERVPAERGVIEREIEKKRVARPTWLPGYSLPVAALPHH
jgi:hypothetical protein